MPIDKEVVKQAQTEQMTVIANNRVTVLKALDELESIGGKDDYVKSLRTILKSYPEGIKLQKVQVVLGDSKSLTAARETMKAEIEQKGEKNILLKLKPEPPETAAVPQ